MWPNREILIKTELGDHTLRVYSCLMLHYNLGNSFCTYECVIEELNSYEIQEEVENISKRQL